MLKIAIINSESFVIICTHTNTVVSVCAIEPCFCASIWIESITIGSTTTDIPLDIVGNSTSQHSIAHSNFYSKRGIACSFVIRQSIINSVIANNHKHVISCQVSKACLNPAIFINNRSNRTCSICYYNFSYSCLSRCIAKFNLRSRTCPLSFRFISPSTHIRIITELRHWVAGCCSKINLRHSDSRSSGNRHRSTRITSVFVCSVESTTTERNSNSIFSDTRSFTRVGSCCKSNSFRPR